MKPWPTMAAWSTPGWGGEGVPAIIDHWTGLMGTTTLEETALPNLEADDVTSVDFLRYAGAPGGQEFPLPRQRRRSRLVRCGVAKTSKRPRSCGTSSPPNAQGPSPMCRKQRHLKRSGWSVRGRTPAHTAGRVEAFDLQGRQVEVVSSMPGECWTPWFGHSVAPPPPHPDYPTRCWSGIEPRAGFRTTCK